MDSWINDVSQVSPVQDVRMIMYKNIFCMVRKLNTDSNIKKWNPDKTYLVRYAPPNKENKLETICYIPITEEEFKDGLKKYKDEMGPLKSGGGKLKRKLSKKKRKK